MSSQNPTAQQRPRQPLVANETFAALRNAAWAQIAEHGAGEAARAALAALEVQERASLALLVSSEGGDAHRAKLRITAGIALRRGHVGRALAAQTLGQCPVEVVARALRFHGEQAEVPVDVITAVRRSVGESSRGGAVARAMVRAVEQAEARETRREA